MGFNSASAMRFTAKRRAAGLCEWCGLPARRRKCETCEQRHRDYQREYQRRKRRAAGAKPRKQKRRPASKMPPPEFLPTHFPPGTPERVAVQRARLRAGFPLTHPDDARAPLEK